MPRGSARPREPAGSGRPGRGSCRRIGPARSAGPRRTVGRSGPIGSRWPVGSLREVRRDRGELAGVVDVAGVEVLLRPGHVPCRTGRAWAASAGPSAVEPGPRVRCAGWARTCRPPPRQPRRPRWRRHRPGWSSWGRPAWRHRSGLSGRLGHSNARYRCRRVIGMQRRRWPVPPGPRGPGRVGWPVRNRVRGRTVGRGVASYLASLRTDGRSRGRFPRPCARACGFWGHPEVFGCAERLLLEASMPAGRNRDHGASNNRKGRPSHNLCIGRGELEVNPFCLRGPAYLTKSG
jgi:hypothetical protein